MVRVREEEEERECPSARALSLRVYVTKHGARGMPYYPRILLLGGNLLVRTSMV